MNDGTTTRPLIDGDPGTPGVQPPVGLTRHYRGAPWHRSNGDRRWPDDVDAGTYMLEMQTRAQAAGKSFEYNWIIYPRVDGPPEVWEYAGEYRAAHSAGENSTWMGVQFANGVDNHPSYQWYDPSAPTTWQPITQQQITAYQWLRDVHLPSLNLSPGSGLAEREHRHMPGARTVCPGDAIIGADSELDVPYQPEPPMPATQIRLFKFDDNPPLFASADGVTAIWVNGETDHPQWQKWVQLNLVDPAQIEMLSRDEAVRYTFVGGQPPEGYGGIWGNSGRL
jgi:hypothetical protein